MTTENTDTPLKADCPSATCSPSDYDAGLLNDFGGGDVGWWQDYLRAEIGRANDYWREQYADMHDAMVIGTRLIDRDLSNARSVIEAIEERYIDGCDTYEDWKFMGDTARIFSTVLFWRSSASRSSPIRSC